MESTVNEKAEFKCKATGVPSPQLVWYKDDKEIKPDDKHITINYVDDGESSLLIVDLLPEDDGTYKCVATNEVGSDKCKAELFVEGEVN